LEFVESHPGVKIVKVNIPFSYRNKYIRKGFLVYLKLANETMVPLAQEAFRQFAEFPKCGVVRENGEYVENLPLATTLSAQNLPQGESETSECSSYQSSSPESM